MNFNHQILSHFKGCLNCLIGMSLAIIFISSQAKADGVILIKNHATQSPQFWRAFAFSKKESSPYNYNVMRCHG